MRILLLVRIESLLLVIVVGHCCWSLLLVIVVGHCCWFEVGCSRDLPAVREYRPLDGCIMSNSELFRHNMQYVIIP
jgi:hypothetical protein